MSILRLLASDGFLSVNKHLARIVGLDAAVLLAELASAHNYFESREQLTANGMFFETVEHIQENTTLTQYQQAKAVKVLSNAGILETKKIGIPAKRYFFINEEAVLNILDYKKSKNLITGDKKTSSQETKKLDCNNKESNKKDNNKDNRVAFTPPTLDEVSAYCRERQNSVDPEKFIDFYQSKGWMVGRNRMKDWKAAVRTWEKRSKENSNQKSQELDNFYAMAAEFGNS